MVPGGRVAGVEWMGCRRRPREAGPRSASGAYLEAAAKRMSSGRRRNLPEPRARHELCPFSMFPTLNRRHGFFWEEMPMSRLLTAAVTLVLGAAGAAWAEDSTGPSPAPMPATRVITCYRPE